MNFNINNARISSLLSIFHKGFVYLKWLIRYNFTIVFPQNFMVFFVPKEVLSGPFKGMKYISKSTGSVILPKLVGTYEDELHSIFYDLKKKNYKKFIDIGAAEGYYVVGVKKYLLTKVEKTIAFEATAIGRKYIHQLSRENCVEGIELRGFCDKLSLKQEIDNTYTFILVDIEGGEYELLDPSIQNFSNCDLLVELHLLNGFDEVSFVEKFRKTHKITVIEMKEKFLPIDVKLPFIVKKFSNFSVNEFRGYQKWVLLESIK